MTPQEINDHCKKIWLGLFIIALILINAWLIYHRDQAAEFKDPRIEVTE